MTPSRILLAAFGLVALSSTAADGQPSRAAASPAVWTLSPKPIVEIGDEANTQTQFNRVSGVLRMPSGEIVVANSLSQELRVFSPSGRFVRALSRSGRGPGEFQFLGAIQRVADSILAVDFAGPTASFLQVYTVSGFKSKVRMQAGNPPKPVTLIGRLANGATAVSAGGFRILFGAPQGTMVTDTLKIGFVSARDSSQIAWAGEFPNQQFLYYRSPIGSGSAATSYSFGHYLGLAVVGDKLWVGDSETGDVTVLGPDGRTGAHFHLPIEARAFDAAAAARAKKDVVDAATSPFQKAGWEAMFAIPFPKMAQFFASFRAGADGEVWVQLFQEDLRAPSSYVVVDRTGKAIGRVTLPRAMTLYDAGRDFVLGVRKDDDGLEHIVQFGLKR